MREIFCGTVMYFDRQHDKLSGRIQYNHGREIPFFLCDGRAIEIKNNELLFSGRKIEAYPKPGDSVIFERNLDSQIPKASPWGYEDCHWRDTLRLRSKPKTFFDWINKPRRKRPDPK